MLFNSIIVALSALAIAASPVQQTRADLPPYPFNQTEFTNTFPAALVEGDTYNLTWTGGSGYYALQYAYIFPHTDWHPSSFIYNDTIITYNYTVPTGLAQNNVSVILVVQDQLYYQYQFSNKTSGGPGILPIVAASTCTCP